MKMHPYLMPVLLAFGLVVFAPAATAESHRATRLGNPATVFAPTIYSPADLRARFANAELQPEFVEILRQWGWPGNVDDLFAAAATNEIAEWQIAVGDTLPFMSSREHGRPVCLRNVTWAGQDPIHAYSFTFHSNGRIWRCVTPKPCSNFFVEDLGPEPVAGLALDCSVPDKVTMGQTLKVSLTVHNTGNVPGTNVSVALPIPDTTYALDTSDGGAVIHESINWILAYLPVDGTKQLCTDLKTRKAGTLNFSATASSEAVTPVHGACATEVAGLPAILLETTDNPDPVAVGDTTAYTVKVTNQGSADDANVAISMVVDSKLVPVSSDQSGATIAGQTVTFPLIPTLAAKQAVTCTVRAKGVTAGNAHTKFIIGSQLLTSPLTAEESTTVY